VSGPTDAPDLLAVLAEPNRRRLLGLLRGGEKTVSELAVEFAVTRPAVSQHLGVLAAAGLVDVRPDGRFRRYRLRPEGMAAVRHVLDSFWTTELELLATGEGGESRDDQQKGRPDDD
jgi:DNA-binding transcriptional ArsR family regulator